MENRSRATLAIGETLARAFGSFRRCLGLHVNFGVTWLVNVVLVYLVFACVAAVPLTMTMGNEGGGNHGDGMSGTAIATLGIFYLIFFVFVAFALGLHQAVTLQIVANDFEGRRLSLVEALRAGLPHVVPQGVLGLLRMVADLLVMTVTVGTIYGLLVGFGSGQPLGSSLAFIWTVIGGAYLVAIMAVVVTRGFIGLAACAIETDGLGPIAAVRRSVELLRGRRVRFILLKSAHWLVAGAAYGAALGGAMAGTQGLLDSDPNGPSSEAILVMLPVMLALYGLMLLSYAFDHAIDLAAYLRLRPSPMPAAEVADVFR